MEYLEFYLLDSTYEVVGGEPHIILWAITRDGRRVILRDRTFRPYFYAILKEAADPLFVVNKVKLLSEIKSPIVNLEVVDKKYYGKPVKALKITTVVPEYVREYREKVKTLPGVFEVVEADIRFSMRYIIDKELRPCGWHIAKVSPIKPAPGYRVDEEYEIVGEIRSLEDSTPPRD
ncbi:MAG: 3'-5' exonuclease, partial [Desulfurococcaceae archaeon]